MRLAEPSSLRGPSSGLRLAETGNASGRDDDQRQAGETDDPNDIDDIQREIEAVKARLNALRGSKRQPA